MGAALKPSAHIVDVLGNVIGRDQPIMRIDKALNLVSLISESTFLDEDVVFFDPFCKAGELLLACSYLSCAAKIEKNPKLLDVDKIHEEIFESNKYFGLSPDERHHRLSLRTFLGNTYSHDDQFSHVIRNGNYVSEEDGNLNKDKFKEELANMIEYIKKKSGRKKIVAVGNPPYQESDGGFGKSAKNIYHYFAEALVDNKDVSEFVLVIPARWFGGGKGMDGFRERMMTSSHLKNLKYFSKANDVFPTVDINGGICFLHFDKTYNGETNFEDKNYAVTVGLNEYDIIPDDPLAFPIINKVLDKWKGEFVGESAWTRKPFGLATNYFDKNPSLSANDSNSVKCLSRGKEYKFANRKHISKNEEFIDFWKVCAPKAAGGSKGKRRSTVPVNQIFSVEKGIIMTETYNVVSPFKTKSEAENFEAYLKTDFARYMVGLRKITQDLTADRWNWVPKMTANKVWTDSELYKYFGITKEEIKHIQAKIEEWS